MKQIAILSVDHTKARFYILKPAERPAEQWSPVLCPIDEFINVHWLEQEKESLSGGSRMSYRVGVAGNSNTVHGFDDHLDSHLLEIDKKFSREINNRLRLLLQEFTPEKLIITADSKILGRLREQMGDEYKSKMHVEEVSLNLCHMKPVEIHERLAQLSLIPRRSAPENPLINPLGRTGQWRRRKPAQSQRQERDEESQTGS